MTRIEPPPRLRVLASGSGGNCSVLDLPGHEPGSRRIVLIDAGLSPRRTLRLLGEQSLDPEAITDVLLTHPDQDHLHPGWIARGLPGVLRLHRRHLRRAENAGHLRKGVCEPFGDRDGDTISLDSLDISISLGDHDAHGSTAMRITLASGATLGYATDLGTPRSDLIDHLTGCDTLAIESNYCPDLLAGSARPEFLKRRIAGGKGHLSNEQCAEMCEKASPAGSVVLLHLSRECNTPDLALAGHKRQGYKAIASNQHTPTPWLDLTPSARPASPVTTIRGDRRQMAPGLFTQNTRALGSS